MRRERDIRAGSVNDAPAFAQLHLRCFPDAWPPEAFASLLTREGVSVLVAGPVGDAQVEGFILVSVVCDEAEVLTFCVSPDCRRNGLGNKLLTAAAGLAREGGAREMFLEVSQANEAALGLYTSHGFRTVGRRAGYYRHGPDAFDALVMRKLLNADILPPLNGMDYKREGGAG
jgi:ribosomal-protein-alanine N-acetyltransferase